MGSWFLIQQKILISCYSFEFLYLSYLESILLFVNISGYTCLPLIPHATLIILFFLP